MATKVNTKTEEDIKNTHKKISIKMIENIIKLKKQQDKEINKLCKVFPYAFESSLINILEKILNLAIDNAELYITKIPKDEDWISWYIYDSPPLKKVIIKDKKYIIKSPLDLYKIMMSE